MPPPSRPNDQVKQIVAAWEVARGQLDDLKAKVAQVTKLAHAKVAQNFIERDLERAYRDLGEAVWAEVSKGRLQLPSTLSSVKKALEAVTVRIQEQNASVNDLLAEGAEAADRLKQKLSAKPVANSSKKR